MCVSDDAETHRAEVAAFRARRDARFRAADGWLTLVERIALEPGRNALPIGTLVVGPPGAAPHLEVAPGVTRRGHPVTGEVVVAVDGAGGVPDVFELDGRTYDVARRGERLSVRVRDPEAPARRAFRGHDFFPLDPALRVSAALAALDPPARETVAHTDGTEGEAVCLGQARFRIGDQACSLRIYREGSSDRMWIPFHDASNGRETYGGGRMLYVDRPAPGEALVLDFNLAFNPPCALNPLVTCPLPPPDNRVGVAILGGERSPPALLPSAP